MPIVTKISEQKNRSNRCNIFLDDQFAFGVNLNVVAKFKLRAGMLLSAEQAAQIEKGEIRQECFDVAMHFLTTRLHIRAELKRQLMRRHFGQRSSDSVLEELLRLDYVTDHRSARTQPTP